MSHCCGSIRSSGLGGQSGAVGSGLPPGVTDGDALIWNATLQLWVPTQLVDRTVLIYNALALTNGTTTLFPSGDTGTNATTVGTWAIPCPWDGRLLRMRVLHNALAGATDVPYTFEVNEVATALTVTLNSGTQAGTNLVDIVNVTAGERIRLRAVNSSGGTLSVRPVILVELWTP